MRYTYEPADKSKGFTAQELADVARRHPRAVKVTSRSGFRQQLLMLTFHDPDEAAPEDRRHRLEAPHITPPEGARYERGH